MLLDVSRLDAIECSTALEVKLLAALIRERRLRMQLIPLPQVKPQSKPEPAKPPQRFLNFYERVSAGQATIKQIQLAVCERFRVALIDMKSDRRQQHLVDARHVAIIICHALTLHSYPEIGRFFGGRDHSTMINAVKKKGWLQTELVNELTKDDSLWLWVNRAHAKLYADRAHPACEKREQEQASESARWTESATEVHT